jgi:hypothetical protein
MVPFYRFVNLTPIFTLICDLQRPVSNCVVVFEILSCMNGQHATLHIDIIVHVLINVLFASGAKKFLLSLILCMVSKPDVRWVDASAVDCSWQPNINLAYVCMYACICATCSGVI